MRKKILAAFIAASVLALALPAGGAYAAEPGEGAAEEAYTETDETGTGDFLEIEEEIIEEEPVELEEGEEFIEEDYIDALQASPSAGECVFFYDLLSDDEKDIYNALMVYAQEPGGDFVTYNTYTCTASSEQEAAQNDPVYPVARKTAAYAVLFDHPEIYWTNNITVKYKYQKSGNTYMVTCMIKFKDENIDGWQEKQAAVSRAADEFLESVNRDGNEAMVAKRIYDKLMDEVEYDFTDAGTGAYSESHSAYGALVNRQALCDGFSKAYVLLLARCGIRSAVAASYDHAWNIVEIGGDWYEIDTSWGAQLGTLQYYGRTTDYFDTVEHHTRQLAYTSRYLPRAEGTRYTGEYMSLCDRVMDNAAPDGGKAELQILRGTSYYGLDQRPDDSAWEIDITSGGKSAAGAVFSAQTKTDLKVQRDFGPGTTLLLAKKDRADSGDRAVASEVRYDNGLVSKMKGTLKMNGDIPAEKVTLDNASLSLYKGGSKTLKASVVPAGSTDAVEWSSSDTSVAEVDRNGKVTGKGAGTAAVTAKAGSAKASCKVTVSIKAEGISISDSEKTLTAGDTYTLKATLVPAGAAGTVTWKTSDAKVAAVSGGKVMAAGRGTCTVTASCGSLSAECRITVRSAPEKITLSKTELELYRDGTFTLKASLSPSDAQGAVTWTSSAPGIVEVSGGKLTAKKAGSAVITASCGDLSAQCQVTVKTKDAVTAVTVSKEEIEIEKGGVYQLTAQTTPQNADVILAWSSTDKDVAVVENGLVKGISPGTAEIRVSCGQAGSKCRVKVLSKAPVFEGTSNEAAGIKVSWKGYENVSSYRVYRKTTGGYEEIGTAEGEWFLDTDVRNGTSYTYTVRSLDKDGKTLISGYDKEGVSGVFYESPSPKAKADVDSVRITWQGINGIRSYKIYCCDNGGSWKCIARTDDTEYNFTKAVSGHKYRFTVRCLKDDKLVSQSAAVPAVTFIRAPFIKSSESGQGTVSLKWDRPEGYTASPWYRVYRKEPSGSWQKLADIKGTSCTDKTVKNNRKYYYTVRCLSSDRKTLLSNYRDPAATVCYFDPPVLTVKNKIKGIELTWNKVPGITGYRIYMRQNSGEWSRLTTVKDKTSYLFGGAVSGKTYSFTVRCEKDGKLASASRAASKTLFMNAPYINYSISTSGKITIKWQKVVGASRYKVFCRTGKGGWKGIGDTRQTSFTWTGGKKGTDYCFTVRCLSPDGRFYTSDFYPGVKVRKR